MAYLNGLGKDSYGFGVEYTPFDELRAVTPVRLVGSTFNGSSLDSNFWTSSLGTGGSASVGNAQMILSTGSALADNATSVQSNRVGRYTGGSGLRYRAVIRMPDAGTANNTRRWGAFNSTDGAFFQLSGTTFSIVTRKTAAVNDIAVNSGSFNGNLGASYTMDTNVKTYEIYWTNSKVYFVVGGQLLHTMSATTTTWADSMSLPVRVENTNSGGSTTDVAINVRTMTIYRLGELLTQPMSKYQSGTTAGLSAKTGAGNLHGVVIGGVSNSANLTLYDGTSTAGTVIWSSGAMPNGTNPFSVDFKGLPFATGLFFAITGANCNVTLIYE